MKIASVCFHLGLSEIGGAQIPAIAFAQWARLLGHECEVIGADRSVEFEHYRHISGEMIRHSGLGCLPDTLKDYDFVFFATPGPMNLPGFDLEIIRDITVPFIFMIHGEVDLRLYGAERVFQFLNHPECLGYAHIDYTGNYWKKTLEIAPWKSSFYFHPCTLPEYLIKPESPVPSILHREGCVYAARFAKVKNPILLATLSRQPIVQDAFGGVIDVYGAANKPERMAEIEACNPKWNMNEGPFNIYDIDKMKRIWSSYKFFWDVNSYDQYGGGIKRLNLSSIEALSCGVIPLANYESVQPFVKNLSLGIKPDGSVLDHIQAFSAVKKASEYFDELMPQIFQAAAKSPIGYNYIKDRVEEILNHVERKSR